MYASQMRACNSRPSKSPNRSFKDFSPNRASVSWFKPPPLPPPPAPLTAAGIIGWIAVAQPSQPKECQRASKKRVKRPNRSNWVAKMATICRKDIVGKQHINRLLIYHCSVLVNWQLCLTLCVRMQCTAIFIET